MKPPDAAGGNADPLSPERWAHVRELVDEVLALPREARSSFLDRSCGDDDALRSRVERLATAYERTGENSGFLAHPAVEFLAPLLVGSGAVMADQAVRADGLATAFCAALADRYAVGAELGRGGMATVYVAEDLRHGRQVALKVLDPDLGAMLGAERFLAEIRVTASLRHPNLLPLFDSGEAGGLLYYVMPLMEEASLRVRLDRERQLPVEEAVRIVSAIAGALDYAHRHGVVHRDLKPGNILLQDGQPLLADFGIALAVSRAADAHQTATGISLGTPKYMSPEQAAGGTAVDGRSDIYSLACVLYELLAGDPPLTGSSVQAIIARVISDVPSSVRTVRPAVPAHVDAALARALAKLPADRYATAREFADALLLAPVPAPIGARAAPATLWLRRTRLRVAAAAAIALATAVWMAFRTPEPPSWFVHTDLIHQSLRSGVTITPDGRTLVYTGSPEAGRPIMLRPVGQLEARAIAGTEGGFLPFVAHDGRRLAFWLRDGGLKTVSLDGIADSDAAKSWRYGNGAWVDEGALVTEFGAAGLSKGVPGGDKPGVLTLPDTAHPGKHMAPLLLPASRAVVFTISRSSPTGVVTGELAIASLDPGSESASPFVLLGVIARRAFAFVDGWLLYTSADGRAIMAVRLDVERSRISGTPVSVLDDEAGNLETASLADNGTLLYVRRPRNNAAVFVDSSGAVRPGIASADGSFMYPRISPLGKRFAMEVTTGNRPDVWLYDIASGTRTQLTTTGRAHHPTWTPDGLRVVFFDSQLGLMSQLVDGGAAAERVRAETYSRETETFAPIVAPDGRSFVFQRRSSALEWYIWSASMSSESAPRLVMDDGAASNMPAVSPDGRWLAYVSKTTGNEEVYVRRFPGPGPAVQVSDGGGIEPSWSPDGHRIYYLDNNALFAAAVTTPTLTVMSRRQLFKGAFDNHLMPHRNYDVAPDGNGFLMITPPANPEVVVVLNWVTELRSRLKRAR